MFPCKYEAKCIPYMHVCDGKSDCVHASDENLPSCFDASLTEWIHTVNVSSDSVQLRWSPISESKVSYIVSYYFFLDHDYSLHNVTCNQAEYFLTKLSPATQYSITVYTNISGVIHRKHQIITVRTLDGVPDQPVLRSVANKPEVGSIEVKWSAPSTFKGIIIKYRVYIKETEIQGDPVVYFDTKDGSTNSMSIFSTESQPLVQGKSYTIMVSALTSIGEGPKSHPDHLTFGNNSIVSFVLDLNGKTIDSNTVTLTWRKPSNQLVTIDNYIVVYNDMHENRINLTTDQTTVNVTGLCPGSKYTFFVAANNIQHGHGPYQLFAIVTSGTQVPAPTNLQVYLVGTTDVKVTWDVPEGVNVSQENFTVFYDDQTSDMYSAKVLTQAFTKIATTNTTMITGLQTCDTYLFRVAVTGSGRCKLSSVQHVLTSPAKTSPPEQLHFTPLNSTAGNLTWNAYCQRDFSATGYIVTRKEVGTGKTVVTQPYLETNQTSLYLVYRQLHPGATYSFTIKNTNQGAETSQALNYTMEPYKAPFNLVVKDSSMGFDSGVLTWLAADNKIPNDKFNGYEVLLCKQKLSADSLPCYHDENYELLTTSQTEEANFTNLAHGFKYFFKVRLDKIDGYYGALSSYEELEVMGTEAPATGDDTVTLNKTNVIAIGVSIGVVVVALLGVLSFFIIRHQRLQRSFHAFASSHYDSRSGTTTFSAADDLDEDDTPLIRGFSDDEPLVIA